jgi:hypothetical protein
MGLDGKLQLEKRLSLAQSNPGGQRNETMEIADSLNPSAPAEALKVERKVIEKSQPIGSNQTERKMEVLRSDLNGGMQSIQTQSITNRFV